MGLPMVGIYEFSFGRGMRDGMPMIVFELFGR